MATAMLCVTTPLHGECVPAAGMAEREYRRSLAKPDCWLVTVIASAGHSSHTGIDQDMKTDISYSPIQQCNE